MFHKNKKKSESLGFRSPRMTRCVELVNSYRSCERASCFNLRPVARTGNSGAETYCAGTHTYIRLCMYIMLYFKYSVCI